MNKIWYAIGDFFGLVFNGIEAIGNTINYIYIVVIFAFLVLWTGQMLKHRRNGEEHTSS